MAKTRKQVAPLRKLQEQPTTRDWLNVYQLMFNAGVSAVTAHSALEYPTSNEEDRRSLDLEAIEHLHDALEGLQNASGIVNNPRDPGFVAGPL